MFMLAFKNYRQLYTKCIHKMKKGVIAAARSWQSKSTRARMPCHLSLYHCVNVLIYVCSCLGTWFSIMWEIAWFCREKNLLLDRKQQKLISVEQKGSLWVFDQNEGSSQHCPWFYVFHTYIFISIFWVVTPCIQSFFHGTCDRKRQEELRRGG